MPLIAALEKYKQNQSVTHFKNKEKSINTMERLKAFSVDKFTLDSRKFHTLTILSAKYLLRVLSILTAKYVAQEQARQP